MATTLQAMATTLRHWSALVPNGKDVRKSTIIQFFRNGIGNAIVFVNLLFDPMTNVTGRSWCVYEMYV